MPLYICEISFLIEQQTFVFNQWHNFLQDIIRSQVYFIDKNPVPIFNGFDEISFNETEDKIAINFIKIWPDIAQPKV